MSPSSTKKSLKTAAKRPANSQGIQTIHLVFASHLDIGYTGSPDRTALDHKEHLDAILRLCRMYPDFRYMVEETWMLREWLDRTSDRKMIAEMRRRIQEGRIEVAGFYATPHSAVCGAEDLNQFTYEARRLRDELGIEIVSAIQNDVPGYVWAYPQILQKSGIKYMFAGLNIWLGGGLDAMHDKHPVWWEGVDGSRVLLYPQVGYGAMHAWNIPWLFGRPGQGDAEDTVETAQEQMRGVINEMMEKDYPYNAALIFCSEGDNQGPESSALRVFHRVREWNAAGNTPRIEVSTLRRYFDHMTSKYADEMPIVRGDWPVAYEWDLVKVRGPQGTTGYREAQAILPTAEKLLALDTILTGKSFPTADVKQTWDYMLRYDEHSAPEAEAVWLFLSRRHLQWLHEEHYHFAKTAWHRSRMLLQQGEMQFNHWTTEDESVIVFNPLWWSRSEEARVPFPFKKDDDPNPLKVNGIIDMETGECLPCDITTMGEAGGPYPSDSRQPCIVFNARNIPPMGYRAFKLDYADAKSTLAKVPQTANKTRIENGRYRVDVDPKTGGIASIFDKQLKRELVRFIEVKAEKGKTGQIPFNGFLSESELPKHKVQIRRNDGKAYQQIEISRPGTWFPETIIRLTNGSEQVEVRNVFDRAAWKTQYPETPRTDIRLQFPFRLKNSQTATFVSGPTGFRKNPDEVVPGAPKDTLSSSAFIALQDDKTCILLSSPVDYLFMPGQSKGDTVTLQTQTVFQRYDLTTLTEGAEIFPYTEPQESNRIIRSFAITSHAAPFDAAKATRFGYAFRTPMVAKHLPSLQSHDHSVHLRDRLLMRRRVHEQLGGGDEGLKNDLKAAFADNSQSALSILAKPGACAKEPAMSWIAVEDPNVAVQAFRQSLFAASNGDDYFILRLQEMTGGRKRKVRVCLAEEMPVVWAAQANLVEEKGTDIPVKSNSFTIEIGPFETATVALAFEI